MDAPPIQCSRTDDGLNIAYWTLGSGPTVLIVEAGGGPNVSAAGWLDNPARPFARRAARGG